MVVEIELNKAKHAEQALRYLDSLKSPLPDESNASFYKQNKKDYESLLLLNNLGMGASEEELIELTKAPLKNADIKRIVSRLIKIDELIAAEWEKEERIDRNPKYWNGYFSGYEATPTGRCEQLKRNIKKRIDRLQAERANLFSKITMSQASDFGYPIDGMCESRFKQHAD